MENGRSTGKNGGLMLMACFLIGYGTIWTGW